MITIPFIIVLCIFAIYKGSFVRKHNLKLYIGSTVIAVIAFLLRDTVSVLKPIFGGFLGLSFLYIVMFTGALKKKSIVYKKLMGIRREYSIIGFILLTPHAMKYLLEFINGEIRLEWLGVIPFIIMIPLFITSFMVFRKRFTFAAWKKLQSFAYIAYILIFVHLIIVSEIPNFLVYIVLFVPYIVLKLIKEINLHKTKTLKELR